MLQNPQLHYLDNAATTIVAPEVADIIDKAMREHWANPSSLYGPGARSEEALNAARAAVARTLGCKSRELYFTSCGSESNNLALLGSEIITRPYLTLGMISWAILLALAVTSTQAMQRKLGRRWQLLHNFVYLVAILAPIHYLWSVKIVSPQPVIYALLAAGLLTWRYKKFRQWWRAIR